LDASTNYCNCYREEIRGIYLSKMASTAFMASARDVVTIVPCSLRLRADDFDQEKRATKGFKEKIKL